MCGVFFSLRASSASDFIICFRASVAVAKPAWWGLYVHLGWASEPFQKGIGPLRLFSQTLLSPFSQSHHHANNPEDKVDEEKAHIHLISAQYNLSLH